MHKSIKKGHFAVQYWRIFWRIFRGCSKNGTIIKGMDIRKLATMHNGGVPLYSLANGTRYRHFDPSYNEMYTFVKHSEYTFPAHLVIKHKNLIVYQYKIAIPETHGHKVVFVEETTIVTVLEFP